MPRWMPRWNSLNGVIPDDIEEDVKVTQRGIDWEPIAAGLGVLAVLMPLLIWILTRLTKNTQHLATIEQTDKGISDRLDELVVGVNKVTATQNEHGNRLATIETTLKERDWP